MKKIIFWLLIAVSLTNYHISFWLTANEQRALKAEIEYAQATRDVMKLQYETIIKDLDTLMNGNNTNIELQKLAWSNAKLGLSFSSSSQIEYNNIIARTWAKLEEYKKYRELLQKELDYNLTILNNLINEKSDLYYKDTGVKLNETEEEKALRKENEKKKNKVKTRYKGWKELFESKKYQDSLEIFKEVCPILSEYSYECNYMIWVAYYETTNYEESLKYLKKAQKEKTTVEVLDYIEKVNKMIDLRKKNFEEYQDNHKKTNFSSNNKIGNFKKTPSWVNSNWKESTKSEKEILQKKDDILEIINSFSLKLSPEQKKDLLRILIVELNRNLEWSLTK